MRSLKFIQVFILIVFLGLFLILFYSTRDFGYSSVRAKLAEVLNPSNTTAATSKSALDDLNLRVRDNGEWLVNRNILQYSAYIGYSRRELTIEALVLFTKILPYVYNKQLFKCLIRSDKSDEVFELKAVHVHEIIVGLHKVTCVIFTHEFNTTTTSAALVAIVYSNEFKPHEYTNTVQYHRARMFDTSIPKRKAVAHCVHMLYGLESIESKAMVKFQNWIDLQKSIGIYRIRLYVLSVNKTVTDFLVDKYGGHFLTFVQHSTSYSHLCEWHEDQRRLYPYSPLVQELFNLCNKTYHTIFNPIISGIHDRTCMNDCYMNTKYEFELMTNYDIDEVILPRVGDPRIQNEYHSMSCDNIAEQQRGRHNYSLYDFGIKLLNLYGRNRVACLLFAHVAFLPNDAALDTLFDTFERTMEKNEEESIKYRDINSKSECTFMLRKSHYEYTKKLIDFYRLGKCLRQRYVNMSSSVVHYDFQSLVSVVFNSRWGKSILDTNLTDTINHHACDNGLRISVGHEHGYAAHFREEIHYFLLKEIHTMDTIFVDLEYYFHLLNVIKET